MADFKTGDRVRTNRSLNSVYTGTYIAPDPDRDGHHVVNHNALGLMSVDESALQPCRDPVKVSGWLNVYDDGSIGPSAIHLYKSKAEAVSDVKRLHKDLRICIATVYVSGTEGVEP